MNRAERIRRVIPGAPPGLVAELAAKPTAEVDRIVAALRQARKDEREHQKKLRRQRRADRENYGRTDDDQVADAAQRIIERSLVPNAAKTLETLTRLKQHYDDGRGMLQLAVDGARAQGYTDAEIGVALGLPKRFARQGVGQRFGRRRAAAESSEAHYNAEGESRLHLASRKDPVIRNGYISTACTDVKPIAQTTTDPAKVTCGNCERTHAYQCSSPGDLR